MAEGKERNTVASDDATITISKEEFRKKVHKAYEVMCGSSSDRETGGGDRDK